MSLHASQEEKPPPETIDRLAAENDALRSLLRGLILSVQSTTERVELVLRRAEAGLKALERDDS